MRPTVKLGEAGEIVTGTTPSKKEPKYWGGSVPFVKPPHLGTDKPIVETEETLTEEGSKKGNLIPKNSIMVCCIGSLGKIGIAGKDLCTNQQINSIIFNDKLVDFKYGYYFCTTLENVMNRMANQALIQIINKSSFSNIEIPLPPLETQKAIVAKLDQIFAELDQTKSEIQKNLDNTDELRKSAYDLKIEELKEKYGLKKLEEICSLITDGSHFSPKTTTKGLPYITVKDIDDEGNIDTENSKKISEEDFAVLVQNGCQPKKGDVLYSKDGTIGKIHLVDDENFVVLSSLAIIRPGKDVKSEYLYQIFHSNFFEKQAVGNKTGAAIKRIVLKTIKSLQIPVPPLSEQKKIVEHLDQVSKEVKALKSQYQSQLDNLEELKKSVLDKAFRGELGE